MIVVVFKFLLHAFRCIMQVQLMTMEALFVIIISLHSGPNYLIFLTLRKVLKFMIVSCCDGNDSQSYNEKDMPLSTPRLRACSYEAAEAWKWWEIRGLAGIGFHGRVNNHGLLQKHWMGSGLLVFAKYCLCLILWFLISCKAMKNFSSGNWHALCEEESWQLCLPHWICEGSHCY